MEEKKEISTPPSEDVGVIDFMGSYELGETLYEGNYCTIKHATQVATGQKVAVKIIDKEKVLSDKKKNVLDLELVSSLFYSITWRKNNETKNETKILKEIWIRCSLTWYKFLMFTLLQIERNVSTMKTFRHPNVVHIYEVIRWKDCFLGLHHLSPYLQISSDLCLDAFIPL